MNRLTILFPYLLFGSITALVIISPAGPAAPPEGPPPSPTVTSNVCGPCGMVVDPSSSLRAVVDGQIRYFCSAGCRDAIVAGRGVESRHPGGATDSQRRNIDVVCGMEVNPSWGIRANHDGTTYYFCTQRCREQFETQPAGYLMDKCVVCEKPLEGVHSVTATYLGRKYLLCSAAHRVEFKEDPAAFFIHTMWGIPTWLYYASIAIVMILSFGVFELVGRWERSIPTATALSGASPRGTRHGLQAPGRIEEGNASKSESRDRLPHAERTDPAGDPLPSPAISVIADHSLQTETSSVSAPTGCRPDRYDLLSVGLINAAFHSRGFRFALQAFVTLLFVLIIAAGLFGSQNPALNIAPLLTWTIWWGLLIVLILFAGKAWCYVCPWDAIAGWTEKLSLWRKTDVGLSLNLKWPRLVRNISIATVFFVGLTWVELGFGVTMKPRVTAYLAIAMLLMAVVSALLFERKSFCRYGCLVGRVSGLYALFAGVELRPRHSPTCSRCRTKECVKGSDEAYGCPTFLYPGRLKENTYCIQCMECVQACPHDNLALNLRPWGSDLVAAGRPRTDEAYLALLMLAITGFHGLTMTPAWQQFVDMIRGYTGMGRVLGFSAGMTLLMIGPIAVYALLVGASKALADRQATSRRSYGDYFIRYAYALLPIALFYHIAHNAEHLLMEGPKILARLSDPLGWGWNLFGTAAWIVPPLISLERLWLVQVLLVLVGHVYSLWIAQRTSLRLFGAPRAALRSQIPMLVGMICFSVFSLWLLKQPMEMRTSAM